MNVLILGSGGREHVFAEKIKSSPLCTQLFIAPGNAGTAKCGQNLNFNGTDFQAVKQACLEHQIDFILPGNEDPLVAGLFDFVKNDPELTHIKVFGPSKSGARLEGSKSFSKEFMQKHQIPTAAYLKVNQSNLEEGKAFLNQLNSPFVLKADGLAAGKGVLIIDDIKEAKAALEEILGGKFGEAGSTVVIEEFLKGIEMSCFVMTDGNDYILLPEAKDYKRIGVADTGLNTGGMGAISPVPFADENFLNKVKNNIVIPTVHGLKQEGIPYTGFIFIGLMNVDGEPKVIEYNCRMGDPETEVVIHRLQSDLLEIMNQICEGKIKDVTLSVDSSTTVTVFLVSGGYPESYQKGYPITGLENLENVQVYHAGTTVKDGTLQTSGGRVLAVTASGASIQDALHKSMNAVGKIEFRDKYYRNDIGSDLIQYEQVQS